MDKTLSEQALDQHEAELQKLKQLANEPEPRTPEPEPRTPEAGDVWLEEDGTHHTVVGCKKGLASAMFGHEEYSGQLYDCENFSDDPFCGTFKKDFTYLGKFDEVYVKISDVREALSYTDKSGDSVLNDNNTIGISAIKPVREALRKLNIIQD